MSLDKNLLKNLLDKLLESRIKRLEKRNNEQIKDLKNVKTQFKKQGEILQNIKIKKPVKKVNSKIIRKKTFDNSKKMKQSPSRIINGNQFLNKLKFSPQQNNNKFKSRNAITPDRNFASNRDEIINNNNTNFYKHNNKYSYIKSRYKEETKKNTSRNNKKVFLTPEPQLKRRRKIIKNNINNIKIEPKQLHFESKKNIDNKNNKPAYTRNINTIKREEDHQKRTIVSDIDLEADQITFVLEELRKVKSKNDNNSNDDNDNDDNSLYNKESNSSHSSKSSSSSNSSTTTNKKIKQNYIINNKEVANKFTNYIMSEDGEDLILLICSFLDKKSKINFLSISKKLIRKLTFYLNDLYDNILKINNITTTNSIEAQINFIKNKYKNNAENTSKHAFSLSKSSIKALDLLNSESYNNVFRIKKLEPPLDGIIIIYRIFFQLIDKEELVDIENNKKFWEKARNYILDNNEGKTGTFLKEYISEFDFTNRNIFKLKKLIYGKEDKLKPLFYENICKTTSLVIFIIKDSLEYCGLLPNNKKIMPDIIMNYLDLN